MLGQLGYRASISVSSIKEIRFAKLVKSVGSVYLSARDPLVPT